MEKYDEEVRRVKTKAMAAPPWILETKSADVIGPVALALNVFPVALGTQGKQGYMNQVTKLC